MKTRTLAVFAGMALSFAALAQPTPPPNQNPNQGQNQNRGPNTKRNGNQNQPGQNQGQQAQNQNRAPNQAPQINSAQDAYNDMKATLGIVPTFMKAFPEEGIAAAWSEFRAIELDPSTALTARVKELIGLGVAAQIPCHYCTYFHTQVARANNASDRDTKEAVAISGMTRYFATLMYGAQIDENAFRNEVAKMMPNLRKQMAVRPPQEMNAIVDQQSAYRDMERTLGVVPAFVRTIPPNAVAPAWRLFRSLTLSSDTSISPKDKQLISLAVAAQVPCRACVVFSTEAAKTTGATDDEIHEAVAMGATTRMWSTVLNGSQIDEAQFRTEVDQIMQYMRRGQKAAKR